MLRPYLTAIVLLLVAAITSGQTTASFGQYAARQDSIFITLYEKRDIRTYTRLLQQWEKQYQKLDSTAQKAYRNYLYNAYYNLSCTYALVGDSTRAFDALEQSIKFGYTNYTHAKSDKDLTILHGSPRFDALLEPLRAVGDYLYILRRGATYNKQDYRAFPTFTYQSAKDSSLQLLRKTFNLDSIARYANDVSKVLNLLHWVHEGIPHDGNHENPAIKNAIQLVEVCRRDHRGLNCRGLATVLNECYLAMGFSSRLVTCLPKDSLQTDPDCHVINVVYIPSLQKWVWTDPTNDAYVMNEKGELLSIAEVRERIINNQPLILNPTANWNHRNSTTKENYLYNYMAKNLYILQCPVDSEYDYETVTPGKTFRYIQLLPLDYFNQEPAVKTVSRSKQTTYVFYNTNNPEAFWKRP